MEKQELADWKRRVASDFENRVGTKSIALRPARPHVTKRRALTFQHALVLIESVPGKERLLLDKIEETARLEQFNAYFGQVYGECDVALWITVPRRSSPSKKTPFPVTLVDRLHTTDASRLFRRTETCLIRDDTEGGFFNDWKPFHPGSEHAIVLVTGTFGFNRSLILANLEEFSREHADPSRRAALLAAGVLIGRHDVAVHLQCSGETWPSALRDTVSAISKMKIPDEGGTARADSLRSTTLVGISGTWRKFTIARVGSRSAARSSETV
ncbi:MAG: hypothetical protein ABSG36_11740 [Acidimicrobiales bacterium]